MSSCNPSVSLPQLLTPQFFEQPPKLLPPSVFRQAITASCKPEGHQENCNDSDPKVDCTTSSSTSACVSAVADQKPINKGQFALGDDSVSKTKKIKLYSGSDPVQDSFNPRCDNQLLLVAENVSYSLAVKQRWKKSAIAPTGSTGMEKVLECSAVTTPTKGQRLPMDTPTHRTGPTETAISRSSDSLMISSVNDGPVTDSVVSFSSPAFIEGRDVSNDDKPLIQSVPQSPSHVSVTSIDHSYRNDFDKVHRGSATKPHTTDNLKPSQVESPSTELDISSWKVKSQGSLGSSSISHCEFVSPVHPKDPRHVVDAEKSTSAAFVRSVETMAGAAVDTESDHMLAQLLQNEEYGHTSRVPGQYVVEQEVKSKVKKPTMDCSSDFEIARRLQQEVDAEVAHSMQGQVDHYPPGGGQRLGTGSDDDGIVHESVGGYYDNNNQYHYTIREHVRHPDVHVGHGIGPGGSSSQTRRTVSSHHHYHAAATAEDMDMSYEALVQLEDISRGLDKDTISRLSNTYKYHPSSSTDKSCSVCLCEFESGELLRSLPCIHAFHKNCIDQWLTDNRHCPVCMKDIDSMIT